jgi:hypothetical protein
MIGRILKTNTCKVVVVELPIALDTSTPIGTQLSDDLYKIPSRYWYRVYTLYHSS